MLKKDGTLRLVLDCRYTNGLFREAPWTPFASPVTIRGLHVPVGVDSSLNSGTCDGHGAALDLTDSFYQFQYRRVAPYFGLEPLRRKSFLPSA